MRVQIVDPPAYTPPYDRSLSGALADPAERERLAAGARAAAAGPYSWDAIAEQHLALCRQLTDG